MKPIEECLDIILDQLKANWNIQPYPPLQAESIIGQFHVPLGRHEFFKGLMKMLLADGYVHAIISYNPGANVMTELDYYTKYMMLTPKGFYFIEQGGYRQQETDRRANARRIGLENSRNQLNQTLLVIGAIGAAAGAIGLIAWEVVKYFVLEHH